MRKTTLNIALAAALGVGATAANAAPISLPPGPVFFQFNNLEQVSPSNLISVPGGSFDVDGDGAGDTPASEGNWGVFNISSMQQGGITTPNREISGGTTFFSDLGPGSGQVSGIFYGLTNTSFSPPRLICDTDADGVCDIDVNGDGVVDAGDADANGDGVIDANDQVSGSLRASGGWMDIVWEDSGDIATSDLDGVSDPADFEPADRTAANDGGKFTDGTLLARLKFDSGIIDGDPVTTINASLDDTIGGGFSGNADSFASVIDINDDGVIDGADGFWAEDLNQDWFHVDTDGDGIFGEDGEKRDLRFSNFFTPTANWDDPGLGSTNDIFGARSNDPGRAFVPEPGTLALLGLGLAGLGYGSRRRKG